MSGLPPTLDVYAIALLTAMLLAGAALAVTLAYARQADRRLLDYAGRLCLVALAFAVFALTFHYSVGHPAGSAESLSSLSFVGAHRALSVVVVLTAAMALASRRAALR